MIEEKSFLSKDFSLEGLKAARQELSKRDWNKSSFEEIYSIFQHYSNVMNQNGDLDTEKKKALVGIKMECYLGAAEKYRGKRYTLLKKANAFKAGEKKDLKKYSFCAIALNQNYGLLSHPLDCGEDLFAFLPAYRRADIQTAAKVQEMITRLGKISLVERDLVKLSEKDKEVLLTKFCRHSKAPIWEMTSSEGEAPSYLLGSMHMLPVSDICSEKILKLMKASAAIAFERKPTAELGRKVEEAIAPLLPAIREMMLLEIHLNGKLEEIRRRLGFYPEVNLFNGLGVERLYQKELEDKEIVDLDDEELHLSYILEERKASLKESPSKEGSCFNRTFETTVCILDAYSAGNLETLKKISEERGDQGAVKELSLKRNEVMSENIDSYIKKYSGKLFAVVGFSHILGEGSILELLEKKGYKIKRIEL